MEEEPIDKGANGDAFGAELPSRIRNRGINAYEAIRRADEEAEAIALEQSALIEQAQAPRAVPTRTEEAIYPDTYPNTYPDAQRPISRTAASAQAAYPHAPSQSAYSQPAHRNTPQETPTQAPSFAKRRLSKLRFWQKSADAAPANAPLAPNSNGASPTDVSAQPTASNGRYVVNPADGSLTFVPAQESLPAWWRRQPYYAIAHLLAISGTFMTAWIFGLLVGQVLPGNFTKPPLQESVLRKSNRLAKSLWHFPQLWQSQTTEIRIEAIPIPDTGPVTKQISLSPIERQPLIDELNAIETEILTIDRRIQILEKQLGRPPYKGADIDLRVKSLRAAIDPPAVVPAEADYVPERRDPSDRLLEVAEQKITLPADALFAPGQSTIKDAAILNPVLDQLVNYPGARVVIRSYSDNQASSTESRKYTLAQANSLSQYLRVSLPEGYRWITIGGGETQAVDSNSTVPGRQRNRRIEILIDTR